MRFFSKNELKCAKTRYFVLKNALYAHYRAMKALGNVQTQYFALKTRFVHIKRKKHWETCKRIELCRIRLFSAKTSFSLRFNAFF